MPQFLIEFLSNLTAEQQSELVSWLNDDLMDCGSQMLTVLEECQEEEE